VVVVVSEVVEEAVEELVSVVVEEVVSLVVGVVVSLAVVVNDEELVVNVEVDAVVLFPEPVDDVVGMIEVVPEVDVVELVEGVSATSIAAPQLIAGA